MEKLKSKLIIAVMVMFGITAFMSCGKEQNNNSKIVVSKDNKSKVYSKEYNFESKNNKSKVYSGEYKIEYRENEVCLCHYIDSSRLDIDFAVILQTEEINTLASIELGKCLISFENNNRIIVINQLETEDVRILTLNEEEDINYLQKASEEKNVNIVAKTFGYGVSIVRGYWEAKSIFDGSNNKFTESLVSNLNSNKDVGGNNHAIGIGVSDCTSGGEGSTSCSISESFGIGCSITCLAGYYACCMSSTTTCKCVKESLEK